MRELEESKVLNILAIYVVMLLSNRYFYENTRRMFTIMKGKNTHVMVAVLYLRGNTFSSLTEPLCIQGLNILVELVALLERHKGKPMFITEECTEEKIIPVNLVAMLQKVKFI